MTPAKKPRISTKPYVPKLRSGAYALILALATIEDTECVTKVQLIELAQPLCDSSFVAASDATKTYNAFASMKTLVEKDLVKETHRTQKRYALTDEGWEMAAKLQKAQEGNQEGLSGDQDVAARATSTRRPTSHGRGDNEAELIRGMNRPRERRPLQELSNENIISLPDPDQQSLGGTVTDKFGTLPSSKATRKHRNSACQVSLRTPAPENAEESVHDDAALAAWLQAEENNRARAANQNPDFIELLSSPSPERQRPPLSTTSALQSRLDRPSAPRDSEPSPILPNQDANFTPFVPPPFQPIHLQPGTFTIELILDNREVRSREDRTYIEKALITQSIRPTVRSLPLGDFFWVARCTDSNLLSRYGEEGTEIALDYIVERKRLDDLISSIKDGRFHEQKFRLRKSGVRNVVYLVEDISISQEVKSKYWEAVQSAVAGTQVINGFFVKRTRGLDETIRYLVRMTRILQSTYEVRWLPAHFLILPANADPIVPTTHPPPLPHPLSFNIPPAPLPPLLYSAKPSPPHILRILLFSLLQNRHPYPPRRFPANADDDTRVDRR